MPVLFLQVFLATFLGFLLVPTGAHADNAIKIKLVTALDREEPWEAHLFHAGHLWVGNSRVGGKISARIEVYRPNGTPAGKIALSHSALRVYPFGPSGVLVLGKRNIPDENMDSNWEYLQSVITLKSGRLSSTETLLPTTAEHFVTTGTQSFFSEFTGGIWHLVSGSKSAARYLKSRIISPGQMLLSNGFLFVIERAKQTGLARIDLRRDSIDWTLSRRDNLSYLHALSDGNRLAVTDSAANEVLLVDAKTNRAIQTLEVPGTPRGLTQLGKCLVVISEASREVSFWDVSQEKAALVDTWDLSPAGDRLKMPRVVDVDPVSGTVYARSNYPCPTCTVTQSSVFMARQPSKAVWNRCK